MTFERVLRPEAIQFPATQRHDLVTGVRHQLDVFQVPIERCLADAGLGLHRGPVVDKPLAEVVDG